MPRLPHRPLLLAICLTLPLAACSDDPADTASADDTIVTTTTEADTGNSTTTTNPTTTKEAEAAYLEAVEHYYTRLLDPNPEDPTISEFHTGASFEQVVERNREMQELGQRDEFPSGKPPAPEVLEVSEPDSSTAIIRACLVDDVVVTQDGQVLNSSVNSYLVEVEMRHTDGRWKMALDTTVERFDGPAGCVQ